MSEHETGGQAFPSGMVRKSRPPHDPGADFHVKDILSPENQGMTLRQYAAIVQDAAAQAREKVLRNHFAELAKPDRRGSYQWFRDYAARALAQPTDDTALQDLILKERTRAIESWTALHMKAALASERERCVDALMCAESDANLSLQECIDAIRALGD